MKRTLLFLTLIPALLSISPVGLLAKSPRTEAAGPEIMSQWNGRTVAFIGDSITDAHQIKDSLNDIYWHQLESILGIKSYCYGISGKQMDDVIPQAEKIEAELGQNVDAIFIFLGTNDYNSSIPLGEWYTVSRQRVRISGPIEVWRAHRDFCYDPETFRGRINIGLKYLKSRYPTKQIILLTPVHRERFRMNPNNDQPDEEYANAIGHWLDEYVQAVKEAGNVWSVPVIDLHAISGLMPLVDEQKAYYRIKIKGKNTGEYWDYLHPGTEGHRRMAYSIAYQLLAYPVTF